VADKALDLGRGGVNRLSQLTGMSRTTITKAIGELRGRGPLIPAAMMGRIRREGAGRKKVEESNPMIPISDALSTPASTNGFLVTESPRRQV